MKNEIDDDKLIEFGNYLKKLRFENGYTLEFLQSKTNINIADLNRIENASRKKINPFHLIALANIYKINVLKFYEMVGYVDKEVIDDYHEKEAIEKNIAEIFDDIRNDYAEIPLFSSVAAGAGSIVDEIPESYIKLPLKYRNLRAAFIHGDSMEPTLNDGGIVIFDPTKSENLKDGDIGIFFLNGDYFVKRFYRTKSEVVLQSDNHVYLPIVVKPQQDEFKIWGKFIGAINI
jgi:repressor|nr:MAG TPA: Repressor protein CI [Caudoviricetes sp.]